MGRWLQNHPVAFMLGFEGGLVLLAFVLALLLGPRPWLDIHWTGEALAWGVLGTLPMLLLLWGLSRVDWAWVRDISNGIEQHLLPLFRGAPRGTVLAVSLMAGIGEELLFRGVIQMALEGWLGAVGGLLLASLLFGLAHALTLGYFLLATLIGIYLGLLYQWTGNLLVPMLAHALYDWIALRWYLARTLDRASAPH